MILAIILALAPAQLAPITLSVNAIMVPQYVVHSHEVIPARAGAATFYYPKWIPGHHRPVGMIGTLTDLHFVVNGQDIPWRRDDVEMTAFHLTLPPGTRQVEIDLDEMERAGEAGTANFSRISWDELLLYPAGMPTDDIPIRADLTIPNGWDFATAMPVNSQQGQHIQFETDSLTRLVDSPAIIGKYFKKVTISTQPVLHELDMAADDPKDLDIKATQIQSLRNVVAEAGAMFGTRHYRDYHWLLTLSDHGGYRGLEHHESSEDGSGAKAILNNSYGLADLLCHEYTHSWNGKFRRPSGLATPDFQQPMKGELLWVYEGFTQHLGHLFAVRSGWWTTDQYRDMLADTGAYLDHRWGRTWRPLQDTAVAVQLSYSSGREWNSAKRGADYYDEGVLLWLEAETIIRQRTNNAKSLLDFCHLFYGGANNGPELKPYTFDDVCDALNTICPYDWHTFWRERLDFTGSPHAPLNGIVNSGWKLVYNDSPIKDMSPSYYSLGIQVDKDGTVADVIPGMPAYVAGLAPAMKILEVNGKKYTEADLVDALKARSSLSFKIDNLGTQSTISMNYTGGPLYPHLVRDDSKPDMLGRIISPYVQH